MDTPEPLPSESASLEHTSDQSVAAEATPVEAAPPPPNQLPPSAFVPPAPRKDKAKLFLAAGIGLIVVALIGLGWLIVPRLLNTGSAQTHITAAALPGDIELFFAFNPHFTQIPNGDVVGKAWGADTFKPLEDNLRTSLRTVQLDWDQDVAPWLGDEVSVGINHIQWESNVTPASAQTSLMFALATRDKDKSDAALTKWRKNLETNGQAFTDQTYRSVTLASNGSTRSGEISAYATVNNVVIFASGVDALHAAIDAALDKHGLDQSRSFQATLAQLRGNRAATLFLDTEQMKQFILRVPTLQSADAATREGLNALQGAGLGLTFESNGLELETIIAFDPDKLSVNQLAALTAKSNPNQLLRHIPANAYLYIGLDNLAAGIEPFLTGMAVSQPSLESSLQQFERETGLNLAKDVFGWMTGEVTLMAMPAQIGGSNQLPVSFALIADAADPHKADATLHQLFQALTKQGGNTIGDITIGDAKLHAIQDARGNPTLIYGQLGDELVVTLAEDTVERITAAESKPLADDETFKAAIAPLPGANGGYFYLKPQPIIDLISLGLTAAGQECPVCPVFEPIRALASANERPPAQANVLRAVVFVLLDVKQ